VLDSTLGADEVRRVLETIKVKAPHTRCLVLTGNTRQEQAARAAGADNILPKRFTTATLFAAIADLLPVPEA
jgi:DNA-binding NarL/FixJ family response regulator